MDTAVTAQVAVEEKIDDVSPISMMYLGVPSNSVGESHGMTDTLWTLLRLCLRAKVLPPVGPIAPSRMFIGAEMTISWRHVLHHHFTLFISCFGARLFLPLDILIYS